MVKATPSTPWAFKVALCLLAPYFYLAVHFSIAGIFPKAFSVLMFFSPFPLLYLFLGITDGSAKKWAYGAIGSGALICGVLGGASGTLGFLLTAATPAVVLGEMLSRRYSLERSFSIAFLAMVLFTGFGLLAMGDQLQNKFIPEMKASIVTHAKTVIDEAGDGAEDGELALLKEIVKDPDPIFWRKIPGALLVSLQILCILSILLLLRWNPKGLLYRLGLSRDYLRRWRTPEALVWPALACIATQLAPYEKVSIIGEILLWPIVFLYFLQGISILSFYLDLFRVRGIPRALIYAMTIAPPFGTAVLSFGFVDLWFNFRDRASRKRRSEE